MLYSISGISLELRNQLTSPAFIRSGRGVAKEKIDSCFIARARSLGNQLEEVGEELMLRRVLDIRHSLLVLEVPEVFVKPSVPVAFAKPSLALIEIPFLLHEIDTIHNECFAGWRTRSEKHKRRRWFLPFLVLTFLMTAPEFTQSCRRNQELRVILTGKGGVIFSAASTICTDGPKVAFMYDLFRNFCKKRFFIPGNCVLSVK